jgi:hypothetical protein
MPKRRDYCDNDANTRTNFIALDLAFQERMRHAIAAGRESAASASASFVKDAPWRPQRIVATAPRSYCGSSAAWAVTAGE